MLLLLKKYNILTFFFFVFVLLAFLAYFWGWKTSGVLENSMSMTYPEGYRYGFSSLKYGDWWVNKESSYYLLAAQGFLGVDGATLNVGCMYEIYRTFYPLLLRSFWFLEPIEAVLVLDIFMWFFACTAIWCTCKNIGLSSTTSFFAIFLTIFGQGFLQSVGEGMPHLAGYCSGYFVIFLISYLRSWEKLASWKDDIPIYAFIGIWQLAYGTAFFFLPVALCATFWRFYQNSFFDLKKLWLLLLLAFMPYLIISLCVKIFFSSSGGVSAIVFENIMKNYQGFYSLVKRYLFVLFDSFVSLGPVALVGLFGLVYSSFREKNPYLRVLLGVCLLQFLAMAVLLLPLAGRGYATFNFYPAICLGAAIVLGNLWEQKGRILKIYVSSFCFLLVIYAHRVKAGFQLPNQIFFTGVGSINAPWFSHELILFQ